MMKKQITIRNSVSIISAFVLLLVAQPIMAAWVENIPTTVKNPDGSVLEILASGDEFFNYLHDDRGFTIIAGEDGYYYYAVPSGDTLTASTYRAGITDPAMAGITPHNGISEREYQRRKSEMMDAYKDIQGRGIHSGTLNNIVVYIRFSDDDEFTNPRSLYDGRLNNQDGPSVIHYFQEVSYGMVTLQSHHFPPSAMNVNVSYQDIHPRSYFQPYHSTNNPNGYTSSQRTAREHQLLHRAVTAVADMIPADIDLDSNNDGRVDNVCFIIKGGNGAWASILWAHRWALFSTNTFINGKRVWDYTFQPETQATVQILNHELFHTFGAPDLYRYSNNTITPVGPWDLMHSGNGHMGAFMKWKYSNQTWISDIPVISEPGTYTLNPLYMPENNAFRINSPNSESEYFVVEYRHRLAGTYENNLPGNGLLVYRINTLAGNGNANGPPDEVYLYRPNGTNTLNGLVHQANYSSQTGRIEINDSTNPSSFLSNGSAGGLEISNVSLAGETITFDLFGGPTDSFQITAAANPAHGGTIQGAGTWYEGHTATLTATAASNFEFQNWTENGSVVSTQAQYSFTTTANRHLIANFGSATPVYNISLTANPTAGGTVSGGGNHPQGASVTASATPANGYDFISWTENGSIVSTQQNYTFTAQQNRQLTANFEVKTYQITLTANPTNGGNLSGGGTVAHGTVRAVNAFPASGFTFVSWTENGTIVSTNTQYMFQVTADRNLVANFTQESTPTYTITVNRNPTNGGITTGGGSYEEGQQATLTATPATGYQFVNWTENGTVVSSQSTYSFTVTGNKTLTANFTLNTHTITLNASPVGGGVLSGSGSYTYGQSATVSASPNTGYTFVNWTENGSVVSSNASYTFNVTGNRTLTANFSQNVYTITLNAQPSAGGTVTGAGNYNHGQSATVTASPATGYTFVNWTENGSVVSSNASYTFNVTGNRTLTANFSQNVYAITLNAQPSAGGTVTGAGGYNHGQSATVTASPATGYTFVNWTENGSVVSSNASYTFNVTGNRTLTANFSQNAYTITLNALPAAGGTVTGAGNYNHGQSATVTASPATGYTFVNWTENDEPVSQEQQYSFIVTEDRTFTAHFKINTYIISLEANPVEGGTVAGAGRYQHGSFVIITASASNDYEFLYWAENGEVVTQSPEYGLVVTHHRHLIAVFESTMTVYHISLRTYPEGEFFGFVSGNGFYQEQEWVQLTAKPRDQSAVFLGWVEKGDTLSKDLQFGFSAFTDREILAVFENQARIFEVRTFLSDDYPAEITGAGDYPEGETATLDLEINGNLKFVGWENAAGQIVSRKIPYSFEVTRNIALKAILEKLPEDEYPQAEIIQVYPNPSNGRICIYVEELYRAEIHNTSGFLVWQQDLEPGQNCIDLAYLQLGMYLINLFNDENVHSRKIILTE